MTFRLAPARTRDLITAGAAFTGIIALLMWAKWVPYLHKLPKVAGDRTLGPSPITGAAGPPEPSLSAGLHYAAGYFASIWPALVAGLLIAAAVEAGLPGLGLPPVLRRGSTGAGALGGLLALPTMMCTCCAAPVTLGLRSRGMSARAALAFLVANPVLNPVVLAFCVFVLPWQWALLRAAAGLLLVGAVIGIAGRPRGTVREDLGPPPSPIPGPTASGAPASRFGGALVRLSVRIVPLHVALVVALGAVRGWLLPTAGGSGATAIAVAVAVGATMLPIPTGGEVAVVAVLLGGGFDASIAGAALITLPAVSLPSLLIVRKAFPARVLVVVTASVVALGLATALAVRVLGL